MCMICTGEIYKEDLNTLVELDVSYCPNLTSEKLQEILIQCKNLKELHCDNCTSLTSLDLRDNINLTELYCSECTSLTNLDLRNNINLEILQCFSCKSLTSLDLRSNINLKMLLCSYCTSLTSIDLRSYSEGVTSFGCVNLITFGCSYCTSLTSLDLRSNINLIELDCFYCTSLTSLDLPKEYDGYMDRSNCPWIIQNTEFSNNLQRLIKLQRWYRKLVLIKYMKSKQFIEWVYAPNNIGGSLYKKWLLKNLK